MWSIPWRFRGLLVLGLIPTQNECQMELQTLIDEGEFDSEAVRICKSSTLQDGMRAIILAINFQQISSVFRCFFVASLFHKMLLVTPVTGNDVLIVLSCKKVFDDVGRGSSDLQSLPSLILFLELFRLQFLLQSTEA